MAVGVAALPLAPAVAVSVSGPVPHVARAVVGGTKAPSSAGLPDVAEAWYATLPIPKCASIPLCPELGSIVSKLLSAAPLDTLRVGNVLGQETARTYLLPNLSAVHNGDQVHGQMVLPVDTSPTAGSISPQTAKIVACLATQHFADSSSAGSGALPKTDCFVTEPLRYDAKQQSFTLDLTPFLRGWAFGRPRDGIALIPSPSAADKSLTSTWLVAFASHTTATPTTGIRSLITTGAAAVTSKPTTPATRPPAIATPQPPPSFNLPGPSTVGAPPAGPPQIAPSTEQVAYPITVGRGFRYPIVFVVPLFMLLGAIFFARIFTSDATPRRLTQQGDT